MVRVRHDGPGAQSTHSRARDVPRAMFQRDKSDRLAYRFVDHVRGRRDDAMMGSTRARATRMRMVIGRW